MQLPVDIATIKGFMPAEEGAALYAACADALQDGKVSAQSRLCMEIGSYCGKSTIYLGSAAKLYDGRVLAIDHHRGSEENQPGEAYYDAELADGAGGMDSLPQFRKTLLQADLCDIVIPIIAPSAVAAELINVPLAFVFIDGGHSHAAAETDYRLWAPKLVPNGVLAIHDVFPNPKDGGRPPFEIYTQALASGLFVETGACGSLRVLRRVAGTGK